MKSEEKLFKEMGISSWTLKKNFSFDGKHITKKDIKNILRLLDLLLYRRTHISFCFSPIVGLYSGIRYLQKMKIGFHFFIRLLILKAYPQLESTKVGFDFALKLLL